MNQSVHTETQSRPSALGAFFSGGVSGLFSGALMAGIIAVISPIIGLGTLGLASAALMVSASTLFGGFMGSKRVMFDAPNTATAPTMVPVPVMVGNAPTMVPVIANAPEAPDAPAKDAPTKSWVESTGRNEGQQSSIQQILANGALSDKDRAAAILAARESGNQQAARA